MSWAAAGLAFLVASATATAAVFFGGPRAPGELPPAPVVFDHRLHVEGQEIECDACHAGCREGVSSGLPGASTCALCHAEPQGESARELELVALIEAKVPLEFSSRFEQPAHVFFSHRRHTVAAAIECAECHGDAGASPSLENVRTPLSMERCVACHEQRGAPVDCSSCHR